MKVPAAHPNKIKTYRQLNPTPNSECKALVPLESAITPYTAPNVDAGDNFDLMQLLSEVQDEEIPDQDLLFAATQLEQNQACDSGYCSNQAF